MRLVRATFTTPVGPMVALASGEALCALEFDRGTRLARLDARLSRFFPADTHIEDGRNAVIEAVDHWLAGYFAGTRADIDALPLDGRGTPFEQAVWRALRDIPPGATCSYGHIASVVTTGPSASRAVGLANGANPIALIVPCHRVIGADGSLTGYGGGLDRKQWLLAHEERHWPTATSLSRVQPRPPRDDQPRLTF